MKKLILLIVLSFLTSLKLSCAVPAHRTFRLQVANIALNTDTAGRVIDDYDKPLTEEDKKNIHYIINTLSSKSMFGLLGVKKDLEEAGKKTNHINPLHYLAYIFSNPSLKAKTKHFPKVAWKRYVRDFAKSLNDAMDREKITDENIKDFSKKVGISCDVIKPLVEKRDWPQLMKILRGG